MNTFSRLVLMAGVVLLIRSAAGQDADVELRKEQMSQAAKSIRIVQVTPDDERADASLVDHSILNFTESIHRQEGSLWIWTHEGRPIAVVELYRNFDSPDRQWG